MNEDKDKIIYVPVEDILPNRFQPRLAFNEKELNELAASIKKYGVIQPIVLRKIGEKYEIIAGERRYKASVLAGLKAVPGILNNTDDNTSAEIALLENLQRKNLSPIEESQSYKKLMDRGFTQEEIANKLGISQSTIANKLRLLNLPKRVQDALLYGRISERHARSLLSLNNADLQINLLERIVSEKLTVKQAEEEVSLLLNKSSVEKDIPNDIKKFLSAEQVDLPKTEKVEIPEVVEPKIEKVELVEKDTSEIDKLLEPEPQRPAPKTEVEEFLDIKVPEVVNIEQTPEKTDEHIKEYFVDNNEINPFQEKPIEYNNIKNNNIEDTKPIINEEKNTIPEVVSTENNLEKEDSVNKDKKLLAEDGSANLPVIINKVRDFIGGLREVSSYITTSEADLTGKYQIVIEINKDTEK